jgi:hypothetical protein
MAILVLSIPTVVLAINVTKSAVKLVVFVSKVVSITSCSSGTNLPIRLTGGIERRLCENY